jgi:hypothetical protein
MFLRFETYRLDLDSGMPEGLFTQAYALFDSDHLPESQRLAIDEHLSWFRKNLPIPDRFSRKRNSSHKKAHGIAWFKDTAVHPLARMRELARLVEDLGYSVRVVRTSRPGYIVYEDEYQVIAEPFHGERRPRTRPG